ncbi:MAG: hypothetical protein ABIH37_03380 [archaeon]
MRIIGFNLTKILIEKEDKPKEKLQVNQNINIKDVSEEEIPISKDKAVRIKFNLIINYSEEYAKVEIEGSVLTLPEKEELKSFLDSWKDKKIPEGTRIPLFNFIMNKCNVKALYLEDEMGLPLHIPMPRISSETPTSSTKEDTNTPKKDKK